MTDFDIDRAIIGKKDLFPPFHVKSYTLLGEALDKGFVQGDTLALVTETEAGSIALLTNQMTYHHIAQGDLKGNPWMVVF